MEKKTKKLQLRKETIAVLNGERMSHVVGGGSPECPDTMEFGNGVASEGYMQLGCYCMKGYVYDDDGICVKADLAKSQVLCISINPGWDCGGSISCHAPICIPISRRKC